MATDLTRIREKIRKEPKTVFTTLYHHVTDIDNLRESFRMLSSNKAAGIDGMSKEEYAEDLETNLKDLSARLSRMAYIPQPKLRKYIPKIGSDKKRPLGISVIEDKIVEMSMRRVLEQIYEEKFKSCSYGYRPNLSQHKCLDQIGKIIQQKRINHVVEADIQSFFDDVNHVWLMRFLKDRIADERILRVIHRMLKSGIMDEGLVKATEEGTPQGSIVSPLLSNVYLHYVLDLWFLIRVKKHAKGEAYLIRYADDFIALFQYKDDAEKFEADLESRLEGFNLKLAKEKTQRIEFGKFARENARRRLEKPKEFTFLGFTHYCGETMKKLFKVKRRTSRKKFIYAIKEFTAWVKDERKYSKTGDLFKAVRRKLQGYLNYYAITDNFRMCERYIYWIKKALFKWVNRRSQRKSYTWKSFEQSIEASKLLPQIRIKVNLNPFVKLINF